jgi:hypothetical protein
MPATVFRLVKQSATRNLVQRVADVVQTLQLHYVTNDLTGGFRCCCSEEVERSQGSTSGAASSRQPLHHCASISGPQAGSRQLDTATSIEERVLRRFSTLQTGGLASVQIAGRNPEVYSCAYSDTEEACLWDVVTDSSCFVACPLVISSSQQPQQLRCRQRRILHPLRGIGAITGLLNKLTTPLTATRAEDTATGICSPLGSPLSPSRSFQHHLPSPLGRTASCLDSLRPQLLSWELDCSTRSQEELVRRSFLQAWVERVARLPACLIGALLVICTWTCCCCDEHTYTTLEPVLPSTAKESKLPLLRNCVGPLKTHSASHPSSIEKLAASVIWCARILPS